MNLYQYRKHMQELEKFMVERAIKQSKTEKEIFHECVVLPNKEVRMW